NWTELDVWLYVYLESIPIVPLYFAAERPIVRRDGTMIMVDDERMPLEPVDPAGDHPGDAARADVRAAGTRDRPRRLGVDGEEEDRGLLLSISDLISEDILAYLDQHEHKSLLRFITCGSVDDGK